MVVVNQGQVVRRAVISLSLPLFIQFCLLVCLSSDATGSPWTSRLDNRLRHHIQVLADSGLITVPVTTWPIMWTGIEHELVHAERHPLTDAQRWSLEYIRFELERAKSRHFRLDAHFSARRDVSPFSDFGADSRDENRVSGGVDYIGDSFAFRLAGAYRTDPEDGDEFVADGSYLAGVWGNWVVALSAIDRWWGPGWQNSLVLSHNARPVPGISVQRNYPMAFENRWLSWIGPWQVIAFAGQMESSRAIPEAKLLGARLSLRPFQRLEIGFSRTAQWGGEGRPEDLDSLVDLIQGKDNVGSDGITEDNEPGNQLAAIDWRWSGGFSENTLAAYGQVAGEDEAGGLPSKNIMMLGLETGFYLADLHHRLILEVSDTFVDGFKGDDGPQGGNANIAYEHSTYQSGYRYRGRPVGATIDNDSRIITLAGQHYWQSAYQFEWEISDIELNRDRTNKKQPGGSVFGPGDDIVYFDMAVGFNVLDFQVKIGAYHATESLLVGGDAVEDSGAYLELDWRLY